MNILWVTNVPLPEASELLGEKSTPFGGWLLESSDYIAKYSKNHLKIAFPDSKTKNYKYLYGKNIEYYAYERINKKNFNSDNTSITIEKILTHAKPDLVHIFGTEFIHTLKWVKICRKLNIKVVISIQGLVSIISKHMHANLPFKVFYGMTLRNIYLKDSIALKRNDFIDRGKYEVEALKEADFVIGRTTWDKATTYQINQNIRYYHCNETLRSEFYNNQWKIDGCERYTIFMSQGQYSFKGLHYMLEALVIVKKYFPKVKLHVGGSNIIKSNNLKEKLSLSYYAKYIRRLISQYDLEKNVHFTGPLDSQEMCKRYLKTHVFVSPSTIENSPNSLGEAMILGVPSVSSDVGGVADLVEHQVEGFVYPHDEPYMLAYYICEIFNNDALAERLSSNSIETANKTHNRVINSERLVEIYNNILLNI